MTTGGSGGAGQESNPAGSSRADGRTNAGKFQKGTSGNRAGRAPRDMARQVAELSKIQRTLDGWESIMTGIGTADRDKRMSHSFVTDHVSYPEAISLWTSDDIAKRAIEVVPDACWREGFDISIPDDNDGTVEWLEKEIKRLSVEAHTRLTHKRERAFGGGGMVLGVNDGQAFDQPLDLMRVTEFNWLTPFEPIVMQPVAWYNDASKPKYGEPSHYQVSPMTFGTSVENASSGLTMTLNMVHESRVIAFQGIRVSQYQAMSGTAGWGYSMFTRIRHVLRDFQIACASAGILAADFSQAIFSMEGLSTLAASNDLRVGANGLKNRLAAIELARSTARAILIDTKEKFERQTTNIQGLPELLAWLSARLAAAVEMPLTLLMGQSPKGLGNEGESDIRWFYDQVASVQIEKIEPVLRRIVEILLHIRDKNNVPKKWEIKFRSLWQPSDKELAETHLTQAQADLIYMDSGVLDPDEVRDQRFGGEYSINTAVKTNGPELPIPTDPATLAVLGRGPDPTLAPTPTGPAPATAAGPPGAMDEKQIQRVIEVVTLSNKGAAEGGITREQAIGILTIGLRIPGTDANVLLGPIVPAPPTNPAPTTTPPAIPPAPAAPPAPTGAP